MANGLARPRSDELEDLLAPQPGGPLAPLPLRATSPQTQLQAAPMSGPLAAAPAPQPPGLGHRILGALGHVGEVAGMTFAPWAMPFIPGTMLNREMMAGQERRAQSAKELGVLRQAETQRDIAGAGEAQARTKQIQYGLEHPSPLEVPPGGTLVAPDTFKPIYTAPEKSPAPNFQHVTLEGPDGEPMDAVFDPHTGQYFDAQRNLIPNPKHYEKPAVGGFEEQTYEDWLKGHPEGNRQQFVEQKEKRAAERQAAEQARAFGQQDIMQTRREKEKEAHKWVVWQQGDREVAGPGALADQMGASTYAEIGAQEQRDIMNARHASDLMTQRGDPNRPETQGVLQLIDALDREGKLGVVASRWNQYLTTGIGVSPGDDPRIITLINKNMLSDTATMLAHFGASGGRSPAMLQHFIDLANAGKMDATTLRAGVKAIANYMERRAMRPQEGPRGGETKSLGKTARPDGRYSKGGKTYVVRGGEVFEE